MCSRRLPPAPLSSTVRHNADSSRLPRRWPPRIAGGGKGGAVVGEVVQQRSRFTNASKRIGEIIGVIDGIAFQTNSSR